MQGHKASLTMRPKFSSHHDAKIFGLGLEGLVSFNSRAVMTSKGEDVRTGKKRYGYETVPSLFAPGRIRSPERISQ